MNIKNIDIEYKYQNNINILGDCAPTDLICTEFNAQQLLYDETFSHTIRIFGSVKSKTESTFPFQYNVIY